MKNGRGIIGIVLAAVIVLCWGGEAYASARWAGLTAVLTADVSSVTRTNSADAPFQATAMVAQTHNNSQYSIMFEARGGAAVGSYPYQEALITVLPGGSNTLKISSSYSYHSLTLTGKNGLTTTKGCIGNGWLEKN